MVFDHPDKLPRRIFETDVIRSKVKTWFPATQQANLVEHVPTTYSLFSGKKKI